MAVVFGEPERAAGLALLSDTHAQRSGMSAQVVRPPTEHRPFHIDNLLKLIFIFSCQSTLYNIKLLQLLNVR